MTDSITPASIATPKRFLCRHIHTDGRRCASPALRQEEFCYYHHTSRQPVAALTLVRRRSQAPFDLGPPEDRGAIQLSIGEVLRRVASNQIDPRRAGLLLYGLQIASQNLPRTRPAALAAADQVLVEDVVIDPTLGNLAPRAEILPVAATGSSGLIARLLEELQRNRVVPQPEPAADTSPSQPLVPDLDPSPAPTPDLYPTPDTFLQVSILPDLKAVAAEHPPTRASLARRRSHLRQRRRSLEINTSCTSAPTPSPRPQASTSCYLPHPFAPPQNQGPAAPTQVPPLRTFALPLRPPR